MSTFDIEKIRSQDFPFLKKKKDGSQSIYLDNASTTQKPRVVIDSMNENNFYYCANVHRGSYDLSRISTERYENTRDVIQKFIGAKKREEIIFTAGGTDSINLAAYSLLEDYFEPEDEIIITQMEHHANIVPWQLIAKKKNLIIKYLTINSKGELELEKLFQLLNLKTKLISVTHCSNVLGTINPVKKISDIAKKSNIILLVDGTQSLLHKEINVQDLGCDFFVFSAHKIYGPTGIGVLYAKQKWHDLMQPFRGGGAMIEKVGLTRSTFAPSPYKFEAGTPNFIGASGLASAIRYVEKLGVNNIYHHEQTLLNETTQRFNSIKGLKIFGLSKKKAPIISFTINNLNSHDIGTFLDLFGISVRVGHHCAQPLMQCFSVSSVVRVSFGVYNSLQEVEFLFNSLIKTIKLLS